MAIFFWHGDPWAMDPKNSNILREWIEDAYKARTCRANMIKNDREMMKYNRICQVHKVTH